MGKQVNPRFQSVIKAILITWLLSSVALDLHAQIWLTGKVYDSTRMVAIPAVKVQTTKGVVTYTDSIGRYGISVDRNDSVSFSYMGKSTYFFPVKTITYPAGFDIALQVKVQDRYKTLKEVVVISKSYKQDSVENRERYRQIFEFENAGLQVTSSGNLDPNSLIRLFNFRKNKMMRGFRNRLIEEEQEKFVNSRFTKSLVKQITGLNDRDIERFMVIWRPPYELVAFSEEYQFHQYILEASRYFKTGILPKINEPDLNRKK